MVVVKDMVPYLPKFTPHQITIWGADRRWGDVYCLPSRPLYMGRGCQRSATTSSLSWPLLPSSCPPPSIIQGLRGERDMGQTDVRGEEELSFSCRIKGGAARAATETSKKQGAKRPANQRRKERARRRRKVCEERRRGSATAEDATATAATGAATTKVATVAVRGGGAASALSLWQEQRFLKLL